MMVTSVVDIAMAIEERDLTMTIHPFNGIAWIVWLHPADDPALGVWTGEGADLNSAIQAAFENWDGSPETSELPS